MGFFGVRGQERAATVPWRLRLPRLCEHAGPTDRQGAGVAVQTQGSGQIRRCVRACDDPLSFRHCVRSKGLTRCTADMINLQGERYERLAD